MMMFEKGLGFTPKSLNPKHIIEPWWYQIGKGHGIEFGKNLTMLKMSNVFFNEV
jgi:hypothetical protein